MAVVGKQMQQSGFTMVELVIVIVITGILATVVAPLIQRPIESYQAMSRRAGLVDKADSALLRMDQELRNALPNSIRIGCSNQCLEFLHTQAGGRYRAQPVGDTLSFNPADTDTSFDILGPLANRVSVQTGSNAADCASNQSACLVIYNTGLAGSNAYLMENAATVTSIVAGTPLTMNFINSFSGGAVAFP
ncbi:MAG: type II secretion system protein, partial [Aestuariibacter sp.]|nr:type II secretion system protein [Aestuariibacter sp.]